MQYEDPILGHIKKLMNQFGPLPLRGHWGVGDPIMVPQSQLPAAFIQYDSVSLRDGSSATLEVDNNIVITVAINQKKGNNVFSGDLLSHQEIVNIIMARDANWSFLPDSIMGVLRAHKDAKGNAYINSGTDTAVEFGSGIEARGPGMMTAEASIKFQYQNEQLDPEYS